MQGLGHVGAAVVHYHGLAGAGFLYAEVWGGPHLFQIARQEAAGEPQVDEAGHDGLRQGEVLSVQFRHDLLCDLDGGAVVGLGGGQSAVALVFAQVRPVGHGHFAVRSLVAGLFEGQAHFVGNIIKDTFHGVTSNRFGFG